MKTIVLVEGDLTVTHSGERGEIDTGLCVEVDEAEFPEDLRNEINDIFDDSVP